MQKSRGEQLNRKCYHPPPRQWALMQRIYPGGISMLKTNLKTVPLRDVRLGNGLLGEKNELIRKEVLPYQWKALNNEIPGAEQSNAVENFRIAAGESQGKFTGMVFQDSDLYKWLEAVAYSLATHPDKELEELADS